MIAEDHLKVRYWNMFRRRRRQYIYLFKHVGEDINVKPFGEYIDKEMILTDHHLFRVERTVDCNKNNRTWTDV